MAGLGVFQDVIQIFLGDPVRAKSLFLRERGVAGGIQRKYIGVNLKSPRFDKLAEVYGAKGYYVERPEDIADTVRDALAQNGPSVIEIPIEEYFPPAAPLPGSSQ